MENAEQLNCTFYVIFKYKETKQNEYFEMNLGI